MRDEAAVLLAVTEAGDDVPGNQQPSVSELVGAVLVAAEEHRRGRGARQR
jgi:hypothetical protein